MSNISIEVRFDSQFIYQSINTQLFIFPYKNSVGIPSRSTRLARSGGVKVS